MSEFATMIGQLTGGAMSCRNERRNVMLDDATCALLRAFGDGVLSEGIRRAAALIPEKSPPAPASGDHPQMAQI